MQHFKPLRTEGLLCYQPAGRNYESGRQATLPIEFWTVIRNYRNGTVRELKHVNSFVPIKVTVFMTRAMYQIPCPCKVQRKRTVEPKQDGSFTYFKMHANR
jgi:hypothetical protein